MRLNRLVLVTVVTGAACSRTEMGDAVDSTAAPPVTELVAVDSGAPMLLPRDEANASFQEFRTRTVEALARKDTAYLYGILAAEIKNTFGGDDGIDGFKRVWKMEDPAGSAVWPALTRVLNMGGQQSSDSTFVAPYVFAFWPDSIDAFENVAVTGESVRVHREPGEDAAAIGTASHSILRFKSWKAFSETGVPGDTTWAQVDLPDGRSGWVRGSDVYSPVSWRAMFVRRADRWLMVLFVAGD